MIKFDDEKHEYTLKGKKLYSVSELCNLILGEAYRDIPEYILKRAAEFGTEVHLMIETYNLTGLNLPAEDDRKNHCMNEYLRLSKGMKVIHNEYQGHYKHYYAGTMDCIAEIDGKTYLIDYKTTSKFHEERVSLQCSLYRLIYGWEKIDGIKCLWLPKDRKGQLYDLKSWDRQELLRAVIGVCSSEEKN